jgi:hypothetical protein
LNQVSVSSGVDTLTVLDSSGGRHGSVNFTPPPAPTNPNAIDAIQLPATAAAGKAFYVDSTGTVRAVAPDGSPVEVAHFPLQAGEEISFAVSPDGTRILAVINQEVGQGDGWRYWVYTAVVDSQVQLLRGPLVSTSILRLYAWTTSGPVAITDASPAYQGCEVGECSPWGHAAMVDPTSGAIGSAVGGADCELWDINGASVLCGSGSAPYAGATPANLSVRNLDGSGARPVHIAPRCAGCYFDARLSPTGDVALSMITAAGGATSTVVVHPDGTAKTVASPPAGPGAAGAFDPYSWLDGATIVGVTDCSSVGCTADGGSLATVDTSTATVTIAPLNVRGNPAAVFSA